MGQGTGHPVTRLAHDSLQLRYRRIDRDLWQLSYPVSQVPGRAFSLVRQNLRFSQPNDGHLSCDHAGAASALDLASSLNCYAEISTLFLHIARQHARV